MVDGLSRLDLDDPLEPLAPIQGREHEIREHLADTHFHAGRLLVSDVGRHVVPALQPGQQQPDDAIVLKLFANRSHEDGTHGASRRK